MNYEHMYTKNINRHLIHILDRSNRRQGVFGNNLMNISLYIFMNLLMNLCDFSENLLFCVVHYILPLYSSYYFSQEITFGRDNRLNFAPLPLGQREHTNPKERKYLVYYLVLSMSNKACHHIHQMKGFYHICFIRLTLMYVFIKFICFSILVLCIVHFLVTLSQSEARACTIANTESRTNKSPNTTRTVAYTTLLALQYLNHISTLK